MLNTIELGPIRPPSEAYSLLIRVTRNCPWNRCLFCHTYKGTKFELRTVAEIKREIDTAKGIYDQIKEASLKEGYGGRLQEVAAMMLNSASDAGTRDVALWVYAGGENAFLQDANTLIMPTKDLLEVMRYLKQTFPGIKRITSYARSDTAYRRTLEELKELHEAGLSRLHIGLESGFDPVLEYMQKGVTGVRQVDGGKKVVAAGISLCEYVLLGLGGKKWWREHSIETAKVLNQIDPDFIRVRTLSINDRMPLLNEINDGKFQRSTDEEVMHEERLLIENLDCHSKFVSDHITNLLQEIEGKLPEDKPRFLAIIDRFLGLPPKEKLNFQLGRRVGMYNELDDMLDEERHKAVEEMIARVESNNQSVDDETIYALMERFI
jgi:radical SAM superfamily enzyme YgiQ (UPF0313 family)